MGKKASRSIKATDYGSPGLARHFTVVPKLTASNGFTGKVVDDTEIDRLLLHDEINSLEHSLLVALLNRLHVASFVGLKSPDLNGVGSSDPSRAADRKVQAVLTITGITERMDRTFGRGKRMALVNLVLMDVQWPFDDWLQSIQASKIC